MVKATRNISTTVLDATGWLKELEENPKLVISDDDLKTWTVETTKSDALFDQYEAFWEAGKVDVAADFCDRLEKYLLSFMADQASWSTGSSLKGTTTRLIAILKIYQPIIKALNRPPDSIFRRLEAFQRNIFRIQPHNKHDASVNNLLDNIIDVCELWFLSLRLDGYKLMGNCVVYLLAKPKMTVPMLTRLNTWSDYFLLFRQPLKSASEVSQWGFDALFRDLREGSVEEDDDDDEDEERLAIVEAPQQPALLELEKVDYLCDAVRDLFTRADVLTVPKGRNLLTTLLTVNRDFTKVALIAIDEVMNDPNKTKLLDPLADVIMKAWTILSKTGHPHRFDLEALIISNLMDKCLRVDNKPPSKLHSKFSLMVTHMYNCTETAAKRMFHSNFDLMVLETVKSASVISRTNALRMLGKCFPLISPDTSKAEHRAQVKAQVDILLLNLAHTCPDFRGTACTAAADALVRAWTIIKLTERSELLKQLAGRLCCDMASVAVRLAAVKAVIHIMEKQTLSRPSLIPFLVAMKVVATDEDEKVRYEYYSCLLKAIQLGLHAEKGGKDMMDSQQLLAHFIERDRPYVQIIGQILDMLLWNLDDLPWFLNNALRLWRDSPAVAVKCFQIIPKTKSPEAVYLVLETIIGQVYKAVKRHNDRLEEDKGAILSMKREAQINNAVEMAGTIWGSTVLLLAQNAEANRQLSEKTMKLLKLTRQNTAILKEINLYRLASRLPFDEVEKQTDYYQWCLEQLKRVDDAQLHDGITLMTFINNWGQQKALIDMASQWLTSAIQSSKKKKSTGEAEEDSESNKSHLGLLYLTMLMSDPDTSGSFNDLEEDVMNLAKLGTELFLKCLPNRFNRKPWMEFAVSDKFYRAHLMFLSMVYVLRIHYKKEASDIRDQFLNILLAVKTHVFTAVNLGTPKNVIFSIQNYKPLRNTGAAAAAAAGDQPLLADTILKALREIVDELKELTKVQDVEIHTQLWGYAPTQKMQTVTLVTPGDTPALNAPPADSAQKLPGRGRNGGRQTKK